ncbi:hypothetical protein ROHU_016568 [Labeo rohita]|uniref:Uncharacterized protein n=1 Tax=Labeo rohita TaxID=84645 RepID=A0A498NJ97_LABRO|nr:hypothetical protein ROHU_016568 [Labeo rohita]
MANAEREDSGRVLWRHHPLHLDSRPRGRCMLLNQASVAQRPEDLSFCPHSDRLDLRSTRCALDGHKYGRKALTRPSLVLHRALWRNG